MLPVRYILLSYHEANNNTERDRNKTQKLRDTEVVASCLRFRSMQGPPEAVWTWWRRDKSLTPYLKSYHA
jgi:hypothetical protein